MKRVFFILLFLVLGICPTISFAQVRGYTNVDENYIFDFKRKLPNYVVFENAIKDSVFEYKRLLHTEYLDAMKAMHLYLDTAISSNLNYYVSISGHMNYLPNQGFDCGISKVLFSKFKLNSLGIQTKLEAKLSSLKTIPYYNGEQLKARTDFKLLYSHNVRNVKVPAYMNSDVLSKYPLKECNYALDNNFACMTTRTTNDLMDGEFKLIHRQVKNSINMIKSRGPICALGAVVPGLGLTLVKKDTHRLRKSLLMGSIGLGAIAIGSKLYSNHYYQNYRADLLSLSAESNYRKANLSQKIFVSSFIGYCALSSVDFSFTAVIGIKNKWKQREINRYFRTHGSILF